LTVIVNVTGDPGQPFAVGVTVIVFTIGVDPELVAVNAGRSPVPVVAVIPNEFVVCLLQL
jgi:hypothetical protein